MRALVAAASKDPKKDRWTVLEVLRWTTGRFEERALDTPRLDAEVMIAAALGLPRVQLYVQFDRPLDLDELAAGKMSVVYPQFFGRSEGMLSEECTGGFLGTGLRTQAGLLWFATLKGIVVVDPKHLSVAAPAPTVVLEQTLLLPLQVETHLLQ